MTSATASSAGTRRVLGALGLALVVSLVAPGATADTSAADKATAEALFSHARELMKEGRYAEACPKLAESQRLDAGVGTMLYLADCYEKAGLTASAWTEFVDAAAVAHTTGQTDREQKARARAAALEPRLNHLSISVVAGGEVPGLEVRGDGRPLDRALWGKAIPLDPGDHAVSATAPGKDPWSTKVHVDASDTVTRYVVVPKLVDSIPARPPAPEGALPTPPPAAAPPPTGAQPQAVLSPRPSAAASKASSVPVREPETPPGRKAGYALIAVGLATGAAGGIVGAVALLKKSDASAGCRADNVCLSASASEMTTALTLATGSTVTLSVGGAVFLAGLITTLATPSPEGERIATTRVRVAPLAGPGLAGLGARGSF
jgi:serine/threonine-protein kinase